MVAGRTWFRIGHLLVAALAVPRIKSGVASEAWWSAGRRRTPTSLGCAPSQRRGGPRHGPPGCAAAHPAPPGAPFPSPARERKKGKGRHPASEFKTSGQRSVGCLTGEYDLRRVVMTSLRRHADFAPAALAERMAARSFSVAATSTSNVSGSIDRKSVVEGKS